MWRVLFSFLKKCSSLSNLPGLLNSLRIVLGEVGLEGRMCLSPNFRSWVSCFEREWREWLCILLMLYSSFGLVRGVQNLLRGFLQWERGKVRCVTTEPHESI